MGKARIICIASMSFSGSTLLSGLFNHVPGVLGIGEAHWVVDRPEWGCSYCGSMCPVLGNLDRRGIRDSNLYQKIAEAAGAGTLVTSDKAAVLIERFTKPKEADIIVLFKRPESMACSNHHHKNIWGPRFDPGSYSNWYLRQLEWADRWGKTVTVVEYEKLAGNCDRYFPKLCRTLGLTPPSPPITFPPPNYHNIAGNITCYRHPRYKEKPILLDERWRTELQAEELRSIQQHTQAMYVWRSILQGRAI